MRTLGPLALLILLPLAAPAQELEPANHILPAASPRSARDAAELVTWWRQFHDEQLNSLIDRALGANLNVQMAQARVRQARAGVGAAKANGLPWLSQTNALRHSSGPPSSSTNPALQKLLDGNGGSFDNRQTGLGITWARNFFGGNRNATKAAISEVGAAEEDGRGAIVTMLGDLASSYIQLRGLQEQLAIAREGLEARRDGLRIAGSKLAAGLATDSEVTPLQFELSNAESQIPPIEASIELLAHRVAVLAGAPPDSLLEELTPAKGMPAGLPDVPVGAPSVLVRRRPDVRKAEYEVAAARARTAVARAERYPQFSFTGTFGGRDQNFSALKLGNIGGFLSVGPSMSIPLFTAGKIRAAIQAQTAEQQHAELQFQQTTLQALKEIEDALAKYRHENDRKANLEQLVAAGRRKLTLARQLFDAGIQDYAPVLDAEQSLIAARSQLAESKETIAEDLIALYGSLGGGWN